MMRITFVLAVLIALTSPAFSQKEKKADSKIDQVTVFLQGAQIKEKGKFSADKGVTKIIFEGMPEAYNQQSIQVKGKGEYIILDVAPRMFYPEPETNPTEEMPTETRKALKLLNDSIDDLGWKMKDVDFELTSLSMEKNMLLNSGSVKGQSAKDSLQALTKAMEYMRVKLGEINKLQLKAERTKQQLQQDLNRMQTRKSELENYQYYSGGNKVAKQPTPQVVVTISADAPVTGTLELSYMVHQAGWSPAYDLRATDINSPVSLTYKANVFQTTGVDWKDVKLKLSTINPNRSNVKPTLASWYLAYVQPLQYAPAPQQYNNAYKGSTAMAETTSNDSNVNAKQIAEFTTMTESLTMVEFDLKIPYSIPSNGQPYLMAIKNEDIPSTYEYFAVPKLDKEAYLMAYLTGWEEMNLLPAVANIYYDGTYVGQTRINPGTMDDKMELPLGRDSNVIITRKKTKDDDKERALSNEKTKSVEYEIALRSLKSAPIKIVIEDQLPMSKMEEVKVEIGSIGKAEHIAETGKLRWIVTLAPKETQKLKFSYDIKYNKDKVLALN
jgi:uncharacterized protein (TIGR02231 family)